MKRPAGFVRYVLQEHVYGWRVLNTIGVVIGYVGLAVTTTKLTRDMTAAWPGHHEFQLYLFLSYFPTVIGWAILLVVTRQLWHRLHASYDQRRRAADISHRLAEVVRRHVSIRLTPDAPPVAFLADKKLTDVLAAVHVLVEKKLGRGDITIVVKYVEGPPESRELRAVVRHPEPDVSQARPERMPATRSVVYKQFSDGTRQVRRVIIRDVDDLDVDQRAGAHTSKRHSEYQTYAKTCGFKSVVAFPLRQPAQGDVGELDASGILGFLSFDCPDANAFDVLFDRHRGAAPTNDGRHLKDNGDIHLFFGLADHLATLAVLGVK